MKKIIISLVIFIITIFWINSVNAGCWEEWIYEKTSNYSEIIWKIWKKDFLKIKKLLNNYLIKLNNKNYTEDKKIEILNNLRSKINKVLKNKKINWKKIFFLLKILETELSIITDKTICKWETLNSIINSKFEEINHKNYWNNKNIFTKWGYFFPNFKFSIPTNWEKDTAHDTDTFSGQSFYDKYNQYLSFYIKNISLWWCKEIFTRCYDNKDLVVINWKEKVELYVKYQKEEWISYSKKWYLSWLDKIVYISDDKNNYIFSIDNELVELGFWEQLDEKIKNQILNSIVVDSVANKWLKYNSKNFWVKFKYPKINTVFLENTPIKITENIKENKISIHWKSHWKLEIYVYKQNEITKVEKLIQDKIDDSCAVESIKKDKSWKYFNIKLNEITKSKESPNCYLNWHYKIKYFKKHWKLIYFKWWQEQQFWFNKNLDFINYKTPFIIDDKIIDSFQFINKN